MEVSAPVRPSTSPVPCTVQSPSPQPHGPPCVSRRHSSSDSLTDVSDTVLDLSGSASSEEQLEEATVTPTQVRSSATPVVSGAPKVNEQLQSAAHPIGLPIVERDWPAGWLDATAVMVISVRDGSPRLLATEMRDAYGRPTAVAYFTPERYIFLGAQLFVATRTQGPHGVADVFTPYVFDEKRLMEYANKMACRPILRGRPPVYLDCAEYVGHTARVTHQLSATLSELRMDPRLTLRALHHNRQFAASPPKDEDPNENGRNKREDAASLMQPEKPPSISRRVERCCLSCTDACGFLVTVVCTVMCLMGSMLFRWKTYVINDDGRRMSFAAFLAFLSIALFVVVMGFADNPALVVVGPCTYILSVCFTCCCYSPLPFYEISSSSQCCEGMNSGAESAVNGCVYIHGVFMVCFAIVEGIALCWTFHAITLALSFVFMAAHVSAWLSIVLSTAHALDNSYTFQF